MSKAKEVMEDYSCRPMSQQLIAPCIFKPVFFSHSYLVCLFCSCVSSVSRLFPVPIFLSCSTCVRSLGPCVILTCTLLSLVFLFLDYSCFVRSPLMLVFCIIVLWPVSFHQSSLLVFSLPALVNLIWILFLQKCVHMLNQ